MSDFLLELSQNPTAKKLIQAAGLPLPLPVPLDRPKGPYTEQILKDRIVVVGGEGQLSDVLATTLVKAGASPTWWATSSTTRLPRPGEAYGRRPLRIAGDEMPEGVKANGLVFDATGLRTPADLKRVYEFFKPRMRGIAKSGRLLVLGRAPEDTKSPEEAAARAGLDGFVRSLGKEVGKFGATANLIYVAEGAEERAQSRGALLPLVALGVRDGQPVRVSKTAKGSAGEALRAPARGQGRAGDRRRARHRRSDGASCWPPRAPTWCASIVRPTTAEASEVAREIGGTVLLADVTDPEAPAKIADAPQGALRRRGRRGPQRRRHARQDAREHEARGVGPGAGHQPRRRHAHHRGAARRRAARRRAHHLPVVGRGHRRQQRPDQLRRVQGRHRRLRAGALAPSWPTSGITVNAIAPGFIETRMTAAIPVADPRGGAAAVVARPGRPAADVGQAITFLAARRPGVTGQVSALRRRPADRRPCLVKARLMARHHGEARLDARARRGSHGNGKTQTAAARPAAADGRRVVIVGGVRDAVRQGVRRAHQARHHRARRRRRAARCSSSTGMPRKEIDGIVWGGVILPGPAPNVGARDRARSASCRHRWRRMTVTRACASGLQAITLAAAAIERGDADVMIAGGSDSTSNAEIKLPQKVVHAMAPLAFGKADAGRLPRRARAAHAAHARSCRAAPKIAERTTGEVMGEAAEKMAAPQRDLARGAGRVRGALAPSRRRAPSRRAASTTRWRRCETPERQVGARRQPRARRHQRREARQAAPVVRQGRHASPPATPAPLTDGGVGGAAHERGEGAGARLARRSRALRRGRTSASIRPISC